MERKHNLFTVGIFFVFICFLWWDPLPADSLTQSAEDITISAQLDKGSIPLNRTATLTLTIKWAGDVNTYEIIPFENPQVSNLIITGNSTSSLQTEEHGQLYSTRVYKYQVQPEEMGMAYIEQLIIKYINKETGKSGDLETHRISLKVTGSVAENGTSSNMFIIIGALVIICAAGIYLYGSSRKKKKAKSETDTGPKISLEEKYLQLMETLKPETQRDLSSGLVDLTKLLRKYYVEKYSLNSPGLPADDFGKILEENNERESNIKKFKEILEKSDILKFSGQEFTIAEYELIYGSSLSILKNI